MNANDLFRCLFTIAGHFLDLNGSREKLPETGWGRRHTSTICVCCEASKTSLVRRNRSLTKDFSTLRFSNQKVGNRPDLDDELVIRVIRSRVLHEIHRARCLVTMAEVQVEISEDIVTVHRIGSDQLCLKTPMNICREHRKDQQRTHWRISLKASSAVARWPIALVWIRANEEMVFNATSEREKQSIGDDDSVH